MSIFTSKTIKDLFKSLSKGNMNKTSHTETFVLAAGLPDKLKVRVTSQGAVRLTIDTSIADSPVYVNAVNDIGSGKTGTGANAMRTVLNDFDGVDEDNLSHDDLKKAVKAFKKASKKARKDTLQFTIVDDDDI